MEEKYLEKLVELKVNVNVFLTCNVKLQGIIRAVDDDAILLDHDARLQLVYKHAISTISAGTFVKEEDIVG